MNENPFIAPKAVVADPGGGLINTQEVARAQRALLLCVLASLIGNAIFKSSSLPASVRLPVALFVAAFSIWCVYRLCMALMISAWIWVLAMFIPLVNLICLVVLNQKATTHLKQQGIIVGLLGAKV